MTVTKLLAGAVCAALIATTNASAEDRAPTGQGAGTVYNSSDLLGMDVRNSAGESLGDIYDFVVDAKSGRINYAVISYGETLGFGGKMFAVAPSALKVNDKRDAVVLEVKEADLKAADGFDANKWPAGPDARWGKSAQGNPDTGNKEHKMVRVSSLDDLDIYTENNEKLGDVYGFAVDLSKGEIRYIAMQYGGVAGIGSKYFAIPYKAADIKAPDLKGSNMNFVINHTKADFEGQAGFDTKAWPATGDVRFKERERK
jgi:sporulation protein YlmC with PRC-barrel domain